MPRLRLWRSAAQGCRDCWQASPRPKSWLLMFFSNLKATARTTLCSALQEDGAGEIASPHFEPCLLPCRYRAQDV